MVCSPIHKQKSMKETMKGYWRFIWTFLVQVYCLMNEFDIIINFISSNVEIYFSSKATILSFFVRVDLLSSK